ncbi:MAG: hemerythrin domain-containing protein [Alphaproteobacteria bacterium]|jgi:hemerythrin-like metal-binding protein|nr:hemerythrin domain-containing protein [Alphaproteobacteria bacterium]
MVQISPSFKIESETIDEDHRHLVEIINEITKAIDDGQPQECARLVPDFVAFSKQHFDREEALLAGLSYPLLEKHRRHHISLDDKLQTMLNLAARVVDHPPARDSLRKELVFFLLDDVINEDLNFKKFLAEVETGAPNDTGASGPDK